ncbi:hypothetical protein MWK25_26935, partial [Escherichia coli]|uniref:hypothetical protein n=1 Tax=Escherichia coli TaxID=562 RepID=UPI00201FA3D6
DPDTPIKDFTAEQYDYFMYGEPEKIKLRTGINTTYEGLIPKIRRVFLDKETEVKQAHVRAFIERAASFTPCSE